MYEVDEKNKCIKEKKKMYNLQIFLKCWKNDVNNLNL